MEDLTGKVFGISSMKASRVTASGLVYLFCKEFEKSASTNLLELFVSGGPAGRAKILFEVALISLAEEGYVSLSTEKRDRLLFTTEVVIITKGKEADDLPRSLERAITAALRRNPKLEVTEVAEMVIGRKLVDPWTWVVEYVMERLVETGCLVREVKKRRFWWDKVHVRADEEAVALLAGKAERLNASLDAFTSHSPELHNRLVRGLSRSFEKSATAQEARSSEREGMD